MSTYIEIRCPSKSRPNDDRSCHHILGGINPKHEIDEIRYCTSCNLFWKVEGSDGVVTMTAVKDRIDMKPMDEPNLVVVVGGR